MAGSIYLFFLLFHLISCSTCTTKAAGEKKVHMDDTYEWYFTRKPEKAAALVVHGLNTRPDRMLFIIEMLLQNGISVLNVKLSGHRAIPDEMNDVSRDIWAAEITAGFHWLHDYADKKNLPIIFTAFSLGGASGLDAACANNRKLFDYALLFAPALTVRWYTHFIKVCYVFGNKFVIPGKTPLYYRANTGTTVAAYKSLFCHIRNIEKADCHMINVPCICFIDPDDELVDSKKLMSFIQKKKLSCWEVILLEKDTSTAEETYHHLIIDARSTGKKTWTLIESNITRFLDRYLE